MTPREAPVGLPLVDRLDSLTSVTLDDYVRAVSEYVTSSDTLTAGNKKAAQIRLSAALGKALLVELRLRIPNLAGYAGERNVAGALRTVQSDVSEFHPLDGLRLAIEIKPINLAIGRALWNRFGDIRTFAVNLHLKFPFAVVGGVLTAPVVDRAKGGRVVDVRHLLDRAVHRLVRAGGRRNEGEAPHLLEGVALVAYDPRTGQLDPSLPAPGSGLRWSEFVTALAQSYDARFGEGPGTVSGEGMDTDEQASEEEPQTQPRLAAEPRESYDVPDDEEPT